MISRLWLLLLSLAVTIGFGTSSIYLGNTNGQEWGGSCSDPVCTSAAQPCTIPSAPKLNMMTGDCDIFITGSVFPESTTLAWTTIDSTRFLLGNVKNLSLNITMQNSDLKEIEFISWGDYADMEDGTIRINAPGNGIHAPSLSFTNLNFILMNVEITDYNYDKEFNLSVTDCTFKESPISWASTSPAYVTFDNSKVEMLANPFISCSSPKVISIASSEMWSITSLISAKNTQFLDLSISDTSITYGETLIDTAEGGGGSVLLKGNMTLGSQLGTISTTPLSSFSTRGALGRNSLPALNLTNVVFASPNGTAFDAHFTQFFDCVVEITRDPILASELIFEDSKFLISNNRSGLFLYGGNFLVDGLEVVVEPGIDPNRFQTNATHIMGSFKTTKLWIADYSGRSYDTKIENMTLTSFIGSTSNVKISGLSNRSYWTFHSVTVGSHVEIDMTELVQLDCVIQDPALGVLAPTANSRMRSAIIPNSARTYVSCSHDGCSLQIGTWYPLFANATIPTYIDFDEALSGYQSALTIETRIIESNVQFRIALPNWTPSNGICPPLPYPAGFYCVDGVLYSTGSTGSDFVFPSYPVLVLGNLTVTGSLSFTGTSGTINVTGCLIAGDITINLDQEENPTKNLPTGPTQLATQGANCSNSLDTIPLNVIQSSKSCKKITVKRDAKSTPSAVFVVFSSSNSRCNVKWIIIGSVLGGVVIIGAVALALIFTFNKTARHWIRPFTRRGKR